MTRLEALEAVAAAARTMVARWDNGTASVAEIVSLRDSFAALDALPAEPQPQGETVTLHGIVQQDIHSRDAEVRLDNAERFYRGHRILAHFTVNIPKTLLLPTIPATVTPTRERGE